MAQLARLEMSGRVEARAGLCLSEIDHGAAVALDAVFGEGAHDRAQQPTVAAHTLAHAITP